MTSSTTFVQMLTCSFLLLALVTMGCASPRPHFGEPNQQISDQDPTSMVDATSGLTNEQLEQVLQRLIEYNRVPQYPLGWERLIRGPEMKRQSRFRQCYFNPVSCFKK